MRSGTRVRRNGAFGARAQGFYIFDYRNKAFWYVSKPVLIRIGCVSMRAFVAFGSGSRRVPPSAVPPLRFPEGPKFEKIQDLEIFKRD